jgi:hypothetical protein
MVGPVGEPKVAKVRVREEGRRKVEVEASDGGDGVVGCGERKR